MNKLPSKSPKQLWSRDELILAFNLYCKTPFSKIHHNNKDIIELASIIHRSPSAVALKLSNFARLDPALQQRNIAGMSHGSKSEIAIWEEFSNNWEEMAFQSEVILAEIQHQNIEDILDIAKQDIPPQGKERESIVKTRVNQKFFRLMILASYNGRCCITGIAIPELLVASHIVPWSIDQTNRLNPHNGLCLNALHDIAFDKGLFTITSDYKIVISSLIDADPASNKWFSKFNEMKITLPQKFIPATEFMEYHQQHVFRP
ncbi:putative restriction endonuclease [Dehalogenimonas lykanthroporepellens BL-DC-9]|nr:putative restriction endonuclease [Dehalogenimonas lykanthroporepellens BL-DC-9]